MKTNIGSLDRIVRVVAGLTILGVGYYFRSWWGLVGLGPLVTAFVRFCPAYPLFRIDTARSDQD